MIDRRTRIRQHLRSARVAALTSEERCAEIRAAEARCAERRRRDGRDEDTRPDAVETVGAPDGELPGSPGGATST